MEWQRAVPGHLHVYLVGPLREELLQAHGQPDRLRVRALLPAAATEVELVQAKAGLELAQAKPVEAKPGSNSPKQKPTEAKPRRCES